MNLKMKAIAVCSAVLPLLSTLVPAVWAAEKWEEEYDQGVALYKVKRYAEAEAIFWKSITDGNNKPGAWVLRGHCQLSEGKNYDAAHSYKTCIDTFKGTPEAALAQQYLTRMGPHALDMPTAANLSALFPAQAAKLKAPLPKPVVKPPTAVASAALAGKQLKDRLEVLPPRDGHPAVTAATIKMIKDDMQNLPPSIYKALNDGNASVHLVPNLVDKWPEARLTPRDDGSNISTDIGRTYGREMYICQQTVDPNTNAVRETLTPDVIQATFYNEVGHALDDIMKISTTENVKRAYEADVQNLNDDVRSRFWLFLQEGQPGQSETCAEIVAALLGGKGYNTQLMHTNFSRTYDVVKKRLNI